MPNWKSYEATVRLLSAIVAAHPNLKLDYAATADKYGDGVTGTTPKKGRAQRTPKKNAKKAAVSSNEEGDDDSDMEMPTPSKKGSPVKKETINKVKGGRVEKKPATPSRAVKNAIKSYVDSDDDGDDDFIIKDEDFSAYDFGRAAEGDEDMLAGGVFDGGNGNGHGYGHGNGNNVAEEEDVFYDDES
ncbi:hypothetical protein BCIN_07g02830 [Botrytis cinerea B05.10]|uniref:Uncharacterized protein n=1 Tax=Botryotinia fuckeliana (strain B05.10) TaxID=332648 RepID=A0A384JMT4_BOTFB|nr:hypothetical protein BCIN_07g02830 [Botrytis cinerea B05.10]ATZ51687.1 hypothetical protein BCIN_07g02830 [Botrytis cinerea B05.10]